MPIKAIKGLPSSEAISLTGAAHPGKTRGKEVSGRDKRDIAADREVQRLPVKEVRIG